MNATIKTQKISTNRVIVQREAEHSPEAVLVGGEVKVGALLLRLVELC